MTTPNLNKFPYYDDFNEEKQFYRILFKPGFPVQARELTQLQTILQNQIKSGARFFVEQGDNIVPGELTYTLSAKYVKIASIGLSKSATDLVDLVFTGEKTGIKARVSHGVDTDLSDPATIFVHYLSSGRYINLSINTLSGTFPDGVTVKGVDSGALGTVVYHQGTDLRVLPTNTIPFFTGERIEYYNSVPSLIGSATIATIRDFQTTSEFIANERLSVEGGTDYAYVSDVTDCVGDAGLASIQAGIYYMDGIFGYVLPQTVVIGKYSNTPSVRIGLEIIHDIVTSNEDQSLLDNSQGSNNYLGEGADRARLVPTLTVKSLTDNSNTNTFIELLRLNQGYVENQIKYFKESVFKNTIATRTFDESGNYTVNPFSIDIKEHSKTLVDDMGRKGVYDPGDTTKLVAAVQPGKAYVKGYSVDISNVRNVEFDKARDTKKEYDVDISLKSGNYIYATHIFEIPEINVGDPNSEQYPLIDLVDDDIVSITGTGANLSAVAANGYACTLSTNMIPFVDDLFNGGIIILTNKTTGEKESRNIVNYTASTKVIDIDPAGNPFTIVTSAEGNATDAIYDIVGPAAIHNINNASSQQFAGEKIGSARISDIVYEESGQGLNGLYRIYLFDIKLNTGKTFEMVRSFNINETTSGNYPTSFRGNLLTELSVGEFNGIPFSEINWSQLDKGVYPYNIPFKILKTVKTDGSSSRVFSKVFRWNNSTKKALCLNLSGQFVGIAKFDLTVSPGDYIIEVNNSDEPTGAQGRVLSKKTIFDSEYSSLIYSLPNSIVKSVNGVTFGPVKKTLKGVLNGTSKTFHLNSGEEFYTLSGTVSQLNAYSVSAKHSFYGNFGILNEDYVTVSPNGSELTVEVDDVLAGSEITVLALITKTVSQVKTKTLISGYAETFMDQESAQTKRILLNRADCYQLTSVIQSTANVWGDVTFDSTNSIDITENYTLDSGQRDTYYGLGNLNLKAGKNQPTGPIKVTYSYFAHGNGSYFSVNSYPGIAYKNIPQYTSPSTGNTYRLSDCIDFRPRVDNIGGFVPAQGASNIYLPTINATLNLTNYEYYLNRIDKLVVDISGKFSVIKGAPDVNPKQPDDSENAMTIYLLNVKAYTAGTNDVIPTYIDNRRYTMRDIGSLEKRIENLEYYTSLSLLERDTASLDVKDPRGLSRFKNGIFVDPFLGHGMGDVTNPDYKCAIDIVQGELRPQFSQKAVDLVLDTSETPGVNGSDYSHKNDLVTLPYVETEYISNPYSNDSSALAKKTPFKYIGYVLLDPSSDYWKSTTERPDVIFNENGDYDTIVKSDNPSSIFGSVWNDWEEFGAGVPVVNSGSQSSTSEKTNTVFADSDNRSSTTNVGNSIQFGTRKIRVPKGIVSVIAGKVFNMNIVYFMREREITFTGHGFKPYTYVFPFFDGINVSNYCRMLEGAPYIPITQLGLTYTTWGDPITGAWYLADFVKGDIITQTGLTNATGVVVDWDRNSRTIALGQVTGTFVNTNINPTDYRFTVTPAYRPGVDIAAMPEFVIYGITGVQDYIYQTEGLVTDSSGSVTGLFKYDPNNAEQIKFKFGSKTLKLTDSRTDDDFTATTFGEGTYYVGGIIETQTDGITATRPIEISKKSSGPNISGYVPDDQGSFVYPLAQTFYIATQGGIFLTSVDVFFTAIDTATGLPVHVEIRNIENGKPGKKIVPFSRVTIPVSSLSVSSDGKTATNIPFEAPVYLEEQTEYALVILADSPNYSVAIANNVFLSDDNSNSHISPHPYIGTLYRPSNSIGGADAAKNDKLKFTLKRAKFDITKTPTIVFTNTEIPSARLGLQPFFTTVNSSYVIVTHPNHGMPSGSFVTISDVNMQQNGISASNFNGTFEIVDPSFDKYIITVNAIANATSIGNIAQSNTFGRAMATQNAQMDQAYILAQTATFQNTSTSWKIKTAYNDYSGISDYEIISINDNKTFNEPRVIGSEIVETNQLSGSKSIYLSATLGSLVDTISPVIDTDRVGIVAIGNRISNEKFDDTKNYTNVASTVKIDSADDWANTIAFTGDVAFVDNGIAYDQTITIDLTNYNVTFVNEDTHTSNVDLSAAIGYNVYQYNLDGVAKGIVSGGSVDSITISNVQGLFQTGYVGLLISTLETPRVYYYTNGIGAVTGNTTMTTSSNIDFNTYVSVGDIINIQSNGARQNKAFGVLVDAVTANTITIGYDASVSRIETSTAVDAGSTRIDNTTKSNIIYSDNAIAKALLNTIEQDKYIVISGAANSENNKSAGVRVKLNDSGNIHVDGYLVGESAGQDITITQLNNFVSDLSATGATAEASYVSRPINLSNPSDSLKVLITAMLPEGTDMNVYYKTIPTNVKETLDEVSYKPFNATYDILNFEENYINGAPDDGKVNSSEFKEYTYTAMDIESFTTFAIKIVFTSTSTTVIPRAKNLRVVATSL